MNLRLLRQLVKSPIFIIALIVCAANWQLILGFKSLQWDALNFWHPWRFFISECYKNGLVPLWDPYTQAGYPVHGDLQGPAYNPEAIATSLLFPSSAYVLNYIYVFYLILGAYGFYKLSLFFSDLVSPGAGAGDGANRCKASLVAGVLYGLCGYTIGNAYFYVAISAALIPWIYYYYLKIITKGGFLDSCKLAIFLFLQVTAGNPSFLIVTGYFLLVVTCMQFPVWARTGGRAEVLTRLKRIGATFILLVILCLPVVLNAYFVIPETTRASGISLEWAAEERFALRNLFSFFTPLVSFERDTATNLSQPLFDSYVGIFTLFFALAGFIKYRSRWVYIFSGIALISFLLSLGLRTPVFGWFFHLPLFNVFRMPRLIFLYDLLFVLLLAGLGIKSFLSGELKVKWFLVFSLLVLLMSAISVWYFNFIYDESGTHLIDHMGLRAFLATESQATKAVLSLEITTGLIVLGLVFYWRKWRSLLICLLLFDIGLNYSLGASVRVFSENRASLVQSYSENAPEGFAPPENIPTSGIRFLTNHWSGVWMNASVYLKQPSYWNDNNFELSDYMKLYSGNPLALSYVTHQPFAFFGDSLVGKIDSLSLKREKTLVLVPEGFLRNGATNVFQPGASDTIICKKVEPQHFIYQVHNEHERVFVLQQNQSKLWRVKVDGKLVNPETCFYAFPLLLLPAGTHRIEFIYEVPYFNLVFGMSLILFVGIVFFVFYKSQYRQITMTSFAVLVGICFFNFYTGGESKTEQSLATLQNEVLANREMKENCMYVINTRDAFSSEINKRFSLFNFIYPEDVTSFAKQAAETNKEYLCCITYKGYFPGEVNDILMTGFGERIKRIKVEQGYVDLYKRSAPKHAPVYEKTLDFGNSGMKGLDVMKGCDFSPGISIGVKEAKADSYDLVFVKAETECQLTDFKGLALAITNNGVFKKYLITKPVHRPRNKEQNLGIYYYLPESIKEDDVINAYFWNDDVRKVVLKKLSLQILRRE